ncbi:hypothetical protein [Lutibacter sp.]|uniref:hypothetical protein n=1 Tax=Lutibacter sp. TaxID=1925666 RepID=UPI0025C42287|nr:hypothetical protein [Lutibacter sp.]MCF6181484.1 hypothetical protein [Lutibacter sp.]
MPKFSELFLNTKIDIKSILDIKFSYTTTVAYTLFKNLGENGRVAYTLSELFIDIPYAIIYGYTYAFLVIFLLKRNKIKNLNYLISAPLLISFFDILENTGIIIMLTKYPEKLSSICNLTSIFTSLKWIFAIITFIIILINLSYLLISKLFIKKYNL